MTTNDRNREIDLTPVERAALEALPRERDPGRLVEERTVKALRARGLLYGPGRLGVRRLPWLAAGVAAAVALFAGGVAVGQWTGARAVATSNAAEYRSVLEAAAAVQRAGSAYVTALAALSQVADTTNAAAVDQGREVALTALYSAALEMMRLAPNDPVAMTIRDGFDRARGLSARTDDQPIERLVWF